ncbi:MAG: STAS domain-containing protein [Rhodocyclaceae bacterium]|nr:STAS domain-containing protein [Rhodocyclaceae bacterium]MDZ4214039.1 STAS domain-containing protein [Rhodocyclaceae bacterium]
MSDNLMITVQEGTTSTRITISGRLDLLSAEKLRKAVRGCMRHTAREVVLEMRDLTYLDSMAMGAILSCRTLLENEGKKLVLAGPQGMVMDALRIANFHKLFEIR